MATAAAASIWNFVILVMLLGVAPKPPNLRINAIFVPRRNVHGNLSEGLRRVEQTIDERIKLYTLSRIQRGKQTLFARERNRRNARVYAFALRGERENLSPRVIAISARAATRFDSTSFATARETATLSISVARRLPWR